jgi:DNA-binding winged helix-turn-helix (wHTH) protein
MEPPDRTPLRYHFGPFTLSPSRRVLLRGGEEVALIPRYFDLLVLLIERRGEAVRRREILDSVWKDVVVSDGALSQAVRTLRRALGDTPRNPRFVRTVSRHGYRFVFTAVIEEPDDGPIPEGRPDPVQESRTPQEKTGGPDPFETAIETLLRSTASEAIDYDARREAAETLHTLGTAEALRRLDRRPGHAKARALLRDARWDLPDAGPVPILGQPGAFATAASLIALRFRRVTRLAVRRWLSAVLGGMLTGCVAGIVGGVLLRFGPGSTATGGVLVALPLVGLIIGGVGAAGVSAGLATAEVTMRSHRGAALVAYGAVGGGAIGAIAHAVGRLTLEGLFGGDLSPVAGGLEGMVLGGAVGLGYALATPTGQGGMAAPRGLKRLLAAVAAGACAAVAAGVLSWWGRYLGAMSLDLMSRGFPGSQVSLVPLARLLGEQAPGALTSTLIGAWEGFMFGFGVTLGLTHRPR